MKQPQFINEIHNAILAIIKQGKPCTKATINGGTSCVYSDGKGNNCIVGKLFTQEELDKYGKHMGAVSSLISRGWRKGVYTDKQVKILNNMQRAHDCWVNMSTAHKDKLDSNRITYAANMLAILLRKSVISIKQHNAYVYIAKLPASEKEAITSYKQVPPYTARNQ